MSTYEDSGVNIEAGNEFIRQIKDDVKQTHIPGVVGNLGGFGAIFDLDKAGFKHSPLLVSSTDGVGSKVQLAQKYNHEHTVGIDLVAMCVNDILCHGAQPLFFLDYYATGCLNVEQGKKIISGIIEGCIQAECALTGGETAEMPTVYGKSDYDLAGFCVGAVEHSQLFPRLISEDNITYYMYNGASWVVESDPLLGSTEAQFVAGCQAGFIPEADTYALYIKIAFYSTEEDNTPRWNWGEGQLSLTTISTANNAYLCVYSKIMIEHLSDTETQFTSLMGQNVIISAQVNLFAPPYNEDYEN